MSKPRADKPTLTMLRSNECRYPIGDPRHVDFHFCGAPTNHTPYCDEHRDRCVEGGNRAQPIKAHAWA